ncbi:hypothetical protein Wenmar_02509 [Wenxinia marina DSM 24838]|uniref:Uncharacterized protein n=1 Tax=Wenxinia marina DSM 24838 TaxID=1123501 RepID=A0A0D0Q8T8_9RHOB|nr:hypothetical protein Wenmar_02509 [Wenxinia marina DSM 24838]
MKRQEGEAVYGHRATGPRLTPLGAAVLAFAVALPGGGLVWVACLFWSS